MGHRRLNWDKLNERFSTVPKRMPWCWQRALKGFFVTLAAAHLAACGDSETAEDANRSSNKSDNSRTVQNLALDSAAVALDPVDYANKVSGLDLYAMRSAQLATEHADTPQVQELARMILRDHQLSAEALRYSAVRSDPPVILRPQLEMEDRRRLEELEAAVGGSFDRQYLLQQVETHQKAYALADNYARSGEDPAMRRHASEMLTRIKQHLAEAQRLAKGQIR